MSSKLFAATGQIVSECQTWLRGLHFAACHVHCLLDDIAFAEAGALSVCPTTRRGHVGLLCFVALLQPRPCPNVRPEVVQIFWTVI
jgi:hypothetical protein